MQFKARSTFSAMLIASFFVSTILFSTKTAKACPPRIPATLLSLYLKSDLIILASADSERIGKRRNVTEYGFSADIERNLTIDKIYKGNSNLKNISYQEYQYISTVKNSRRRLVSFLNRSGSSVPVKVGGQYLFFFRESKNGKYTVTDFLGGIKNSDEKLGIYEENFKELEAIVENKNNQIENVTGWLVNALDEPATRWGAIQDLYNSSNSLAYEKRRPKNKKNQNLVLGKGFNSYSPQIARSLNDEQKAKISNILRMEIQDSWYAQKAKRIDYRLPQIVKTWGKAQMATDAFTILQGLDESQFKLKLLIMDYISNITSDRELRNNYYAYSRIKIGKTEETQSKNLRLRAERFQKFNNRFQTLLIQNFEATAKN